MATLLPKALAIPRKSTVHASRPSHNAAYHVTKCSSKAVPGTYKSLSIVSGHGDTMPHGYSSSTSHGRLQHLPQRWRCKCLAAGNDGGSSRLNEVLRRIDQLNSQDPRTIEWEGQQQPYELAYSNWLTGWVKQLEPNASEELLIVARGQHVERWKSPRSSYPDGRAAYLKWREDLKHSHANIVRQIMAEVGYDEASISRVKSIILKKDLKKDPETQTIEDALCLVFLERQLAEFRLKEPEDKMVDILRKSWRKMGERGRAAAMKLQLSPEESDLISKALSG